MRTAQIPFLPLVTLYMPIITPPLSNGHQPATLYNCLVWTTYEFPHLAVRDLVHCVHIVRLCFIVHTQSCFRAIRQLPTKKGPSATAGVPGQAGWGSKGACCEAFGRVVARRHQRAVMEACGQPRDTSPQGLPAEGGDHRRSNDKAGGKASSASHGRNGRACRRQRRRCQRC